MKIHELLLFLLKMLLYIPSKILYNIFGMVFTFTFPFYINQKGGGTLKNYSALQIAQYIVHYATNCGTPVTPLKLQKILYFVWIGFYIRTKQHLFNDDFYAWQLGPVVPSVYDAFCIYGGMPIYKQYPELNICSDDLVIIDDCLSQYISYSARELVDKTHEPSTAWYHTYNGGRGKRQRIPFEDIIRSDCEVN